LFPKKGEMKMPTKERVEYVIKAKIGQGGKKGEMVFVPHSHQSDVTKAVTHFDNYRKGMEARTKGHDVWIEKHIIKTKVMQFTRDAETILKNGMIK
jgi:hypothetical protein